MLRSAGRVAIAAALLVGGCTKRLYEGPPLPREQVAVIHAGNAIVRGIDGTPRRGGAFDASEFEVTPGPHRLVLVFERPALNLGMKTLPTQPGAGICVLEFTTAAGRHYFLGSRVRGELHNPHWDGAWEGWVRDPTVSSDDDVITRCESQERTEEPATLAVAAATPPPALAPSAPTPLTQPPAPVVVPVVAATAAGPGAAIRLGAWNLDSLAGSDADVAPIAAAIAAHFDVVAITAARPVCDALQRALAPAWDGLIADAPRPDDGGGAAAHYAVLFRRDRVRPCAGWETLRHTPAITGDGARAAAPATGCFEAEVLDVPGLARLPIAVRVR